MMWREKNVAMQKLQQAIKEGKADEPALPLLDEINSKDDYFTSSSCYGRVLVIDAKRRKNESRFLGRWHRKITFEEAKEVIDANEGNIWFRFEPFILHISCRDIPATQRMLAIKTKLGFKRGGVFQIKTGRVQIELEGTDLMAVPVKDKKQRLVTDDYLRFLVKTANDKFDSNEKKWQRFREEVTRL